MTKAGRIDTHHHIVPPAYADWLQSKGVTAGGAAIPKWSVESDLALMDSIGVETAILSVSTPGVNLGDDAEARIKAREVNEFAADVVRKHPTRFGFFATLTLPDVEGSIAEAGYAFDKLKADGIVLYPAVGGTYLGDPSLEPLMEELNRRRAVIFLHPSALSGPEIPGIPPFAADFLLDTVRAAINYARRGCLERYPNLKLILSHGGGFVPYAAERIAHICSADGSNQGGIDRLRRFYFDTALASSPYSLPCLLAFADPTHITFGCDWPYARAERASHFTHLLDDFPLNESQRHAITRGNAEKIFPRLA
jgi:predicted TIM-barrel fold metal-dependent hydrolase